MIIFACASKWDQLVTCHIRDTKALPYFTPRMARSVDTSYKHKHNTHACEACICETAAYEIG